MTPEYISVDQKYLLLLVNTVKTICVFSLPTFSLKIFLRKNYKDTDLVMLSTISIYDTDAIQTLEKYIFLELPVCLLI